MNKACLLDTNIVLDILEDRQRMPKVYSFLENFEKYYISSKTFFTVFYILRKSNRALENIKDELSFLEILEVNQNHCQESVKIAKNIEDVEDCCELVLAKEKGLWFVTADYKFASKYTYKKLALIS